MHLGPGDDRAGDGDALLLAARQGRRARAGAVGETNPGQHLAHRPFDFLLVTAGDAQRQRDIVERGKMPDQAKVLEHHADPAAIVGQGFARRAQLSSSPNKDIRPRVGRWAR